ncbi:MAG: TonB-dependent receptor family protein [Porphyromonas sp.]|nr:TonB-dependent receptor family protein [Porphyromonas sp.]
MRRIVITLVALVTATLGLNAQAIKGLAQNHNGEPLPFVTVKAVSLPDSIVIVGTVTKEDGSFLLSIYDHQLPVAIEASMVGYTTESIIYGAETESAVIRLDESATMLEEVAVTADKVNHRLVAGGLSTAIEGSPLARLTDIYTVLRGVPLVEVEDESIKVTGKGAPVIYINDRRMTDEGQLRDLKPHLIKEIQVITNPGAKYDASVGAVIKIFTRREPGMGLSGQLQTALNKRQHAKWGYLPYVSFNYRYDNWDFFASSWHNKYNGYQKNEDVIFHGKTPDNEWLNQSELEYKHSNREQVFVTGVNYEDDVQSAGVRYKFWFNKTGGVGMTDMTSRLDMGAPVEYHSLAESETNWHKAHRPSLYYLRKIGNWKAQIDVDYYRTNLTNTEQKIKEGHTKAYELRTLTNSNGHKYESVGTRVDINGPLWGGRLNVGGDYSWANNRFYNYNDADLNLPDLNSRQKEQILALYTEYGHSIAEKLYLSLGLRLEHLSNNYHNEASGGDQVYRSTNLFPTLSLSGQLWGLNTQLSFRSKIYRPSFWRLQPQYQYISRYEYQIGDPNLKPEINYQTQLMVNKNWFTLMLSHEYNVGRMSQEAQLMPDPQNPGQNIPYMTLLKHINLDPFHTLGANVVAAPTVKWWHPTLTLSVQKFLGFDLYFFDKVITNRKPTVTMILDNRFDLPHDLNIGIRMATAFKGGSQDNMVFTNTLVNGFVDVSKRWLKDKSLTTAFSAENIFTPRIQARVTNKYTELYNTMVFMPTYKFTVTYRFNATRDKYKGKGALGSVINRM